MEKIYIWWRKLFERHEDSIVPNNLIVWVSFFILGCCVYFMKISNDLSNPDSIWNGVYFKKNSGWEISLGRYMIAVLQVVRNYIVNTSFVVLVSLILLSTSIIYILKIFDIKTLGWKLVIGALIIISPTVGSTLTYYYCSDLYMLSYFFAVLSVWFMIGKGGAKGIISSSITLMLSAAIYQAYISLAILLCLMYLIKLLINNEINSEQIYKSIKTCILGGILGIILYLSTNKFMQIITGIKASEERGFSHMGMIDIDHFIDQIRNCYITFFQYYFSDSMINNNYYGRKYINLLFFAGLAVIIIIILLKQKLTVSRKISFVFLLLFMPLIFMSICILAPKVSVLDNTGVLMLPTMNYIYVFAVILFQNLNKINSWFSKIGIGLFIQLVFVFFMLLLLELGGQVYIKHNMLKTYHVAAQIQYRIQEYEPNNKICIIGTMEEGNYPELYPDLQNSQHWVAAGHKTIWPTFEGTQNCWTYFIKQYMGEAYTTCSLEEYYTIIDTSEYSEMGIFPAKNGISVINDIIVIKLSDAKW